MTEIDWKFIAAFAVVVVVSAYLIGVKVGKNYSKRKVTLEFQQIIHQLLHFAAQQDYKSIHLMLHDLVDDDSGETTPIKQEEPAAPEENLSEDIRKLTKGLKPEDRKSAKGAVDEANKEDEEPTQ